MKWRLVQFSSVVVGQTHNPTILNPDFLAQQGIVPKPWGWGDAAETVTTPPLAFVRYKNGVNITVEQNKLQVTDPNVEDGPGQSKVTEIAASYVQILPHVRYTAVGNNFQSVVPLENAGEEMKNRFLNDGPWKSSPSTLEAIGVKLSYPLEKGGRLVLTLDAAEATLPDSADMQPVIVANANFSRECGDHPAADTAVAQLNEASNDWSLYKNAMKDIFGAEN